MKSSDLAINEPIAVIIYENDVKKDKAVISGIIKARIKLEFAVNLIALVMIPNCFLFMKIVLTVFF